MYLTKNENGERLLVTSASDLSRAAECEFAVARDLDARLGRLPAVEQPKDAMLERTSTMGDAHEVAIIADYRARAAQPDDVIEIDRADSAGLDAIEPYAEQTLDALQRGVPVIVQATFVDREHSAQGPRATYRSPSSGTPTSSCGRPTAPTACKTASSRAARK